MRPLPGVFLVVAALSSLDCAGGCGGATGSVEGERSGPVRLEPGLGEEGAAASAGGPTRVEETAVDPPPVEPPP